jgi:hypothetical protein
LAGDKVFVPSWLTDFSFWQENKKTQKSKKTAGSKACLLNIQPPIDFGERKYIPDAD